MSEMHIEPGQKFSITYGENGATCEVVALSLRQKIRVAQIMEQVQSCTGAEAARAFVLIGEALEIACPGKTDDPAIDERLAGEIIGKCLAGSSVSEEQQKKSE